MIQLKSNEYWGKRFGCWISQIPKGMQNPTGFGFKLKRRGKGSENKGPQGTKLRMRQPNRRPYHSGV